MVLCNYTSARNEFSDAPAVRRISGESRRIWLQVFQSPPNCFFWLGDEPFEGFFASGWIGAGMHINDYGRIIQEPIYIQRFGLPTANPVIVVEIFADGRERTGLYSEPEQGIYTFNRVRTAINIDLSEPQRMAGANSRRVAFFGHDFSGLSFRYSSGGSLALGRTILQAAGLNEGNILTWKEWGPMVTDEIYIHELLPAIDTFFGVEVLLV